ncbi:hypothetical protein WN48_03487 [Eufriesea mexicana]|uniref:PWWP domain-containing protein n=1 Tax=Eufriesea mexicana TaxID=516756 RepID=A0A310SF87_9HYME|nr:hypothetical protein WN48_03487 [Eufriesea mexicana]
MCEQTEINYLEGDVVWVKLGACWWPGQVTGFHNLPEDIQREFQKKPLIAAVKFFQEDTYEFVKNYQQIYKYNCTMKDEFIRKGLDKYRSRSKDGSRYMDKFPGDVEMAEKLTGGDPDILSHDKFCPEEKPNISALFGDKKIPKKKRERDESHRKNDSIEVVRKITHPRFLRESDHEVRIRQQPSSLSSTPNNSGSPQYPCHLCNFTSSRVNVIICHIKSHRSGNSPILKSKVKTYSQYKNRYPEVETPKRKYAKKEKSQTNKSKSSSESGKRKQIKQTDKAAKKKKTSDPKIRDTILADWEDESDEEISLNQSKPSDLASLNNSPTKNQFDFKKSEETNENNSVVTDTNEIIEETEKLLKETEKLTTINITEDSLSDSSDTSKNLKSNLFDKQSEIEKDTKMSDVDSNESTNKPQIEKETFSIDNESKLHASDKNDKKSLLSCFDFHEEEPSIPPVRKKARAFHQKKEIIKEFEMSQALKTEQEKETENDKPEDEDNNTSPNECEKLDTQLSLSEQTLERNENNDKAKDDNKGATNNEIVQTKEKIKSEKESEEIQTSSINTCETELEIVEIFEVEKVETETENATNSSKNIEVQNSATINLTLNTNKKLTENKDLNIHNDSTADKHADFKHTTVKENIENIEREPLKQTEETLSERFTVETEDETISESAETFPEQSENSDAEMLDQDQVPNSNSTNILLNNDQSNIIPRVLKRRGRPRKSESVRTSTSGSASGSESPRRRDNKNSPKTFEKFELERRTSESDSERSYSGRKRKPNKKYVESDIYVQDVDQKIYKTDESQSENEENFEKVKIKSKRSKRCIENVKKINESIKLKEGKEIEISCNTMDTTENNINSSNKELKDNLLEDTSKKQVLIELDEKLSDNQTSIEIPKKIQVPIEEKIVPKGSDTFVFESTKSLAVEDSTSKSEGAIFEHAKTKDNDTENILTSSNFQQEDLKNFGIESSNTLQLKFSPEKETSHQLDTSKTIDMLPPKKSQIKKFELSQIDFFDTDTSTNKITVDSELDNRKEKLENLSTEASESNTDLKAVSSLKSKGDISEQHEMDTNNVEITKGANQKEEKNKVQDKEITVSINQKVHHIGMETLGKQEQEVKLENLEQLSKDPINTLSEQQAQNRTSIQTRYKGKFTPETGAKLKKDKELFLEEKSTNTFQEAFLKTLHMDKKKGTVGDSDTTGKAKKGKKLVKKKTEEIVDTNISSETTQNITIEEPNISENIPNLSEDNQVTVMSNFGNIEVVVDQNLEIETKVDETIFQNVDQLTSSSSNEFNIMSKSLVQSPSTEDNSKSINLDVHKLDESSRTSTSTPSPSSDVTVPVKKREMPRIIENVTLTEPMQILKSKLLDKLPQKGIKHKLETESTKKLDQKGASKAKIMKIESLASNTKMKTGAKVTSPHLSITKKLQVLKAEEAETATMIEAQNEQLNVKSSKTPTTTTSEKYIQQSSQSLADMELDINSMPFVLSEDVLTPESIEQMPVVISSIIPASSTIPATLSFTPTTQIVSPTQTQFKLNETTSEVSPTKKKSGPPAILKNKTKAKPTITSIKTLVPPFTGGVKGIKFQNTPATNKVPPLLTQKGSSGKYVVVQTSGGQQLRYGVQGKTGTQQKIAIPTGKNTGNAQVVQQGSKVVILTSAQSGQTKMLPLNISKTLSGKVQRIMTSKGQVFCPISPQGIINSKTIIAPKGDGVSATTSKLPAGHKVINTQGILASKGVLTPISGTIGKTALLGTLSQGILTKGGIYTPISASTLSGKTIIGSKALVTKGTTILSSQNLGSSKAILTPISQAITGKTILSTQGIVSTKATVLTPITGQQVKAIAAKSPSKGNKVQYQSVQQKVQLPMLQKSHKVSMSATSQGRSGQMKTGSSTVVLQNTIPTQKTIQQGKKIIKQKVQGSAIQNITHQGGNQQTIGINPQIQQKGKAVSTSSIQKVIIPRGSRQPKTQQKIVVQKVQEPVITTVQNIQSKQTVSSLNTVPNISKTTIQQKQTASSTATTKVTAKNQGINKTTTQQQKNLLNIAMNSVTATNMNTNLSTSLSLPPLEPIESERKPKIENILVESVQKEQPKVEKFNVEKSGEIEKIEEPKITTQPQIMALPTESSDGTQTYVLVTIDEQGQIQPLDNNTLMSLEGTTQNPDGTRTLYIDPSSLGEAGTLDNIVLQFDNGVLPNIQTSATESTQTIISESFSNSEVIQTSNQDILAAALANTDFQQEISLTENPTGNVMSTGLTQTSLINQTILQSTIIPPTEPISSPSVLETSLTLNQPIMTPLEVPSNLPIQSESTPTSAVATIPSSLELPITITNPNISYISTEAQIQIPGNSMPDIGEIMENPSTAEIARTEIPASTQYLVLPNLEDNITVETSNGQSSTISMPSVSYSVSIPNNIVLESSQVQTTPSMPIIDDTYAENVQFTSAIESSMATEQTFVDVPVSEMLVSKSPISTKNVQSQNIAVTSEIIVSHDVSASSQEPIVSTNESSILNEEQDTIPLQEVYSSQDISMKSQEVILKETVTKDDNDSNMAIGSQSEEVSNNDNIVHVQIVEQADDAMTSSMSIMDENTLVSSESNLQISPREHASFEVSESNEIDTNSSQESQNINKFKELNFGEQSDNKVHSPICEEQAATSNEVEVVQEGAQILPAESLNRLDEQSMDIDEAIESKIYAASTVKESEDSQRDEPSSQGESNLVQRNLELHFEEGNAEASHEAPSQSYEQFGIAMTTDSTDLPSQSATKSENSREPSQSITYEPMETDEEAVVTEPPTQSFEHSKMNEASQSYEASAEASTNAPTQSFNELMQSQEERSTIDDAIDDQTFPTQSYEVEKTENIPENLETDAEISQEGNMPSQSNDIGTDGIGTSSVSTNNSGLNEDETASSSYVPETPENQERDPDQESAISTSSCEIPPCAELNIASSSAEHTSIHDNGVPEIPTSSYNLNPDITSTHVDSVPTSSYEEQNVSTSYEVPISMPGLEETPSQNFVAESTDHRNEPSSYYTHHQEVTASYYESVGQETNSRLDGDPQEEVTPSYYDGNPQEASQSYFNPEEATPSYSSHNVSPSYYDHRPESEASQSYYSADDIEKSEQSSSQNIEASQSFYQEQSDELKLTQQGEATPTYTERYPVDYTLENSPIERHDLVESSVPATRPTER